MRIASLALALLSLACAAFAAWGLGTAAGRHAFDEMAGILPLASAAGAAVFALGALWLWLAVMASVRSRRSSS